MNRAGHAHATDAVRHRYAEGSNCAQTVIGALSGTPGLPSLPTSLGAGFTAGVGGTGCVCGALAGGVVVLGEYASTQDLEPAAARRLAEDLSATLHARFTERFGAACCRVIKAGQIEGSDGWLAACASLTEETVRMVADIVADHSKTTARGRWTLRDVLPVARRAALDGLAGGAIALLAAIVASAPQRADVFAVAVFALGAAAIVLEPGGPAPRRVGRVLRATGAASAASLAVAGLLAPARVAAVIGSLLATGPAALVAARTVLAVCALVVAASSALTLKRYR